MNLLQNRDWDDIEKLFDDELKNSCHASNIELKKVFIYLNKVDKW